jgi:serine/threonine protein kinase
VDQDGTPFGRYRLIELIGRGGMGEVWRAYDTETHRVVAVKVLPANLASDPTFEQRFRREALAAAGLNEPHVVPIHHFGEIDGRLYVDMRLVEGRDLQAIIAEGALEPRRAVMIIEQVASALNAAHRIGLVHRDVKPSNVLVAENDFAYLIDFGIARAAGDTAITRAGGVIGTWAYMAPERLSTDHVDPRVDTYALACVLHECLTGSQPFPGDSIERQVGGHLGMPPPRPSALRSGVPVQLDAVIATGMAKNPEHRYATTGEMAAAAREAIAESAPLPSVPRNYYPGSASAGQSQTDATQYVEYSPGSNPTPPAGPPTDPGGTGSPPHRKRKRIILASGIAAVITVIGIVAAFALVHPGSSKHADAPLASGGPFTGTFTVDLGPAVGIAGKEEEQEQSPGKETWKLRSACGAKGCVATATRTAGAFTHPVNMVFDDINGRWIAVTVDTERCNNQDVEEWHWIYLRPRPDGSMAGEWIEDSIDCYAKRTVTFTKTGDADINGLPDPAGLPARVASPALGLHGFYRSKVTGGGQARPQDEDYSVDTFCVRGGDRCLSRFVLTDFTHHQLFVFANNSWTRNTELDVSCPAGGISHVQFTGVFPLPKPPKDPILSLSGHGNEDSQGTTCKGGPYDQVFTRVRD